MTRIAMTREINDALGHCELTYQARVSIDLQRAREQHARYESVLESLGCRVIVVPTEGELADSVFIEDTVHVLEEAAILLRPGAASRRPEVAGVANALKPFRTLHAIEAPGTVDGGDLLRVGKTIYAGASTRTNQEGIRQLAKIAGEYGYRVVPVSVGGCLHLKSAVTEAAPGFLLVNPAWIDAAIFGNYALINVDPAEADAANVVRVGDNVIASAAFPRTIEKLAARGIDVTAVDVSELQKAEGATTCCSLIFDVP